MRPIKVRAWPGKGDYLRVLSRVLERISTEEDRVRESMGAPSGEELGGAPETYKIALVTQS